MKFFFIKKLVREKFQIEKIFFGYKNLEFEEVNCFK